jgi:hypothetical protein
MLRIGMSFPRKTGQNNVESRYGTCGFPSARRRKRLHGSRIGACVRRALGANRMDRHDRLRQGRQADTVNRLIPSARAAKCARRRPVPRWAATSSRGHAVRPRRRIDPLLDHVGLAGDKESRIGRRGAGGQSSACAVAAVRACGAFRPSTGLTTICQISLAQIGGSHYGRLVERCAMGEKGTRGRILGARQNGGGSVRQKHW